METILGTLILIDIALVVAYYFFEKKTKPVYTALMVIGLLFFVKSVVTFSILSILLWGASTYMIYQDYNKISRG